MWSKNLFWCSIGKQQEQSSLRRIWYPTFTAIDDKIVSFLFSYGFQCKCITTRLWFWQAKWWKLEARHNKCLLNCLVMFESKIYFKIIICNDKNSTVDVANIGKYKFLCSSVPYCLIRRLFKVFWMSQGNAMAASTLASSSITKIELKNVEFEPPYSDSISIPINCKEAEVNKHSMHDISLITTFTNPIVKHRLKKILVHCTAFVHFIN